jgi:hypothetical protein
VYEYVLSRNRKRPRRGKAEIDWFLGKPEEYVSLGLQVVHTAALGQFSRAEDLSGKSVLIAGQRKLPLSQTTR